MRSFSPLTLALALTALVSGNPIEKRAIPLKSGYTITFSDDFTGPAGTFPSDTKWKIMTGTKYPGGPEKWGNNEVQTYARNYTNVVTTASQTLSIRAQRQPDNSWTSGRIESKKTDFVCRSGGKMQIETRIKLGNAPGTSSQGIWPAFWALGTEYLTGPNAFQNWPLVSEWDIVESINGQARTYSVAHCGTAPGGPCNEYTGLSNGGVTFGRAVWHVMTFEVDRSMVGAGLPGTWRNEQLNWYLDGQRVHSVLGSTVNDEATWNNLAHKAHYLIFNVAVGGNWAGPPNSATRSKEVTGMEVDYVAVYNL